MSNGRFIKTIDKSGEYRFTLEASNFKVILRSSEGYKSSAGCDKGIASVRANAPLDSRYLRFNSTDGQYMFTLKAGNGEPIGVSERYQTSDGRDNGIESVKKNAPLAIVVDQT